MVPIFEIFLDVVSEADTLRILFVTLWAIPHAPYLSSESSLAIRLDPVPGRPKLQVRIPARSIFIRLGSASAADTLRISFVTLRNLACHAYRSPVSLLDRPVGSRIREPRFDPAQISLLIR